jgi:lipopolysaccharide transport system permease protein
MIWAIFIESINSPLQQISNARGMLSKLNFPREALIVSGFLQNLFNASIKIVLMLGVLVIMGINPGWNLIYFPFSVMSLILVGTTIGLLITPIGVLYSDVGRALPLLTQFLMYVTPVVFPIPKEGIAATLFSLNPATPLIATTRDLLTGQTPELLGSFLTINSIVILCLIVAWGIFRLAMPILIERMGG